MQHVREKRSTARHPPGFYKRLHSTSTVDLLSLPSAKRQLQQRLTLEGSPAVDLPSGVYPVERIIAERRSKKVPVQLVVVLLVTSKSITDSSEIHPRCCPICYNFI